MSGEKLHRNDIPQKFYKDKSAGCPVVVSNVGQLKKALEELPDDLPLNQGYTEEGGAIITVYNMTKGFAESPHLEFCESEDW